MIREAPVQPLSEHCIECRRSYYHAMTCSKYSNKPTPEETVPMATTITETPQPATGECTECQWFGGHDTSCSQFTDDALTLDGTTGAPVETSVTVDGEPAIIKNVTPEPKLLITAPSVDDAIAQLQRTTVTLQAAKAVTARAKATQKTAQEAVDTAVTSVLEAYGESHEPPLPFTAAELADDDSNEDEVDAE